MYRLSSIELNGKYGVNSIYTSPETPYIPMTYCFVRSGILDELLVDRQNIKTIFLRRQCERKRRANGNAWFTSEFFCFAWLRICIWCQLSGYVNMYQWSSSVDTIREILKANYLQYSNLNKKLAAACQFQCDRS